MEREGEILASTLTTKKAPRNRSLGFLRAAIKLLLRRHGSKRQISAAAKNKLGWRTLVGVRAFRLLPPPSPPQHLSPPRRHPESRYASAVDLQAIDSDRSGAGVEGDSAAGREPSAIDMQAEEFIARFYEEMRLQDVDG